MFEACGCDYMRGIISCTSALPSLPGFQIICLWSAPDKILIAPPSDQASNPQALKMRNDPQMFAVTGLVKRESCMIPLQFHLKGNLTNSQTPADFPSDPVIFTPIANSSYFAAGLYCGGIG
jgi:hypothetical protein